jgi:hypothetical protein
MKAYSNLLKNSASTLTNEDGVVLVAAILILVLLTIIGVVSMNISSTEIKTSFNEVIYQQNLYQAEGATMEASELLDGIADPKSSPPSWLEPDLNQITNTDINDNMLWQSGLSGTTPQASSTLADTQFIVVSEGVVGGTSLGLGSSKVHAYSVFGRCAPPNRGATIVEIGYLKAF